MTHSRIELRPSTIREANAAVARWHRHHRPVVAARFSVAAYVDGELEGVVIVESPKARALNDGYTFEVSRLCTKPSACANVASRLLGAAWRASKAMGVRRLVSYTRTDEQGACYRVAGWRPTGTTKGMPWTGGNKRTRWLPGIYEPSTEIVDRTRWEIGVE